MVLVRSFLFILCVITPTFGATKVDYTAIKHIRLTGTNMDVQFLLHDQPFISVIEKPNHTTNWNFTFENDTLVATPTNHPNERLTLQLYIPATSMLDLSLSGNSRVFVPSMQAPVRISAKDSSQLTVQACTGLVLHGMNMARVKVHTLNGDASITLSDTAEIGIKDGGIQTALMTIQDASHVSVAAHIDSLNLTTKGKSTTKIKHIKTALVWKGYGIEHVMIESLEGVADLMASYDCKFVAEHANLKTLLAATSSTAKIEIKGETKDAAFSTRGASQIIVDKVTGNIIRKNQSTKGIITIRNP